MMIVVNFDQIIFVTNQMDASNKMFLKGLLVVPPPLKSPKDASGDVVLVQRGFCVE